MSFRALFESALVSPQDCDFQKLRTTYVESDEYNPYGQDRKAAMRIDRLLQNREFEHAETELAEAVEKDPLCLELHMMAVYCYNGLGKIPDKECRQQFIQGLVDAIRSQGDGRSPETAMKVIDTREEYAIMSVLNLEPIGQSLIEREGKRIDKLSCREQDSGKERTLYFDVSTLMKWLERRFPSDSGSWELGESQE